jgi:hypothetical protein
LLFYLTYGFVHPTGKNICKANYNEVAHDEVHKNISACNQENFLHIKSGEKQSHVEAETQWTVDQLAKKLTLGLGPITKPGKNTGLCHRQRHNRYSHGNNHNVEHLKNE